MFSAEFKTLPRFGGPKSGQKSPTEEDENPNKDYRINISPPRSRSNSVASNTSTSSKTKTKMGDLLNKIKAKVSDHPNAVSEDHPHKPTSGVQDPPENPTRTQLGQGGSNPTEQDIRFGSVTDESVGNHTFAAANGGAASVDHRDVDGGRADAQQAVRNVEPGKTN